MSREPVDHTWSNWGKALFRVDSATDYAVVSAAGEIDMHTAAGLQEAILTAAQKRKVLQQLQAWRQQDGLGTLDGR